MLNFQNTRLSVVSALTSVFYTRIIRYSHVRVWFLHAELFIHAWVWFWHDFHTHECDLGTYVFDYDTHKCDYDTHECDFHMHNTLHVILKLKWTEDYQKKIRIGFWLWLYHWFYTHVYGFGTLRVIYTLMREILTRYVLNYFSTILT
jgi:hypothetical protein